MSLWRQLTHGLRVLVNRSAADTDVGDEVQHYIDQATAAHIARGLSAADALRAGRLVRDAVQDLSGPRRAHLRACGDETCSGIFLDHNGRRRWCSDERCGNRVRVRAHRARTRPT